MSIRIEVYQGICKVFGDRDATNYIQTALTREVEGAKHIKKSAKTKWDGKYRFFNRMSNTFKVGLLDYVCRKIKEGGYDDPIVLEKRWTFPLNEGDLPPIKAFNRELNKVAVEPYRDYQKRSIVSLAQNAGGLIHIATNGGKSFIIAGLVLSLINKSPFKALILIHRKELLTQLTDLFALNADPSIVGMISSEKVDVEDKSIVIAMVQTLNQRINKDIGCMNTQEQDIIRYVADSGILVIDEVHHAKAKTYSNVIKKMKKCMVKAGFSGTVQSDDSIDGLRVRELIGSVVERVPNSELVDRDISLEPKFFFYRIGLEGMEQLRKEAKRDYFLKRKAEGKEDLYAGMSTYVFNKMYEAGVVYNEDQLTRTLETTQMMIKRGLQTLIIVNRRETHGVVLADAMEELGIPHVLWTGKIKDRKGVLEQFASKKVPVMIATSVVDEGLNVHSIDCIIMASGMKSHIQLLQRLGRGLRKGSALDYLLVIDFVHFGEKNLLSHSKERIKLWKDEGFGVEYVDTPEDLDHKLKALSI